MISVLLVAYAGCSLEYLLLEVRLTPCHATERHTSTACQYAPVSDPDDSAHTASRFPLHWRCHIAIVDKAFLLNWPCQGGVKKNCHKAIGNQITAVKKNVTLSAAAIMATAMMVSRPSFLGDENHLGPMTDPNKK